MSDNIKAIEQRVDLEIDPNGAPGSILATNHNGILKEVLSKVGKYSGSSYNANKTLAVFPSGSMSWNNNAMNTVVDFTITVSKLTAELNDFGELLNRIEKGALMRFKDYVGRNVYLLFQSFVAGVDGSANDIYTITVKGVAQNVNYTYQVNEVEPCMISIESSSSTESSVIIGHGNFSLYKAQGNSAVTMEVGDVIMGMWLALYFIGGIYTGGDVNVLTNYDLFMQNDL